MKSFINDHSEEEKFAKTFLIAGESRLLRNPGANPKLGMLLIFLAFVPSIIFGQTIPDLCPGDPDPADQVDLRFNEEYVSGNCPADDIQILGAFLETGDACNTCEPGTTLTASLKIRLNHKTESSDRFLGVFANLTETINGTATECSISRSTGPVLKSSQQTNGEQILDFGEITFTCGSELKLNNILLVWTAANGSSPITPQNNPNGKYCYANGEIIIVPPLNAVATGTDITCASDGVQSNDGTIDLTVSGGTAPFTYSWSNGATTEDLSGLSAGTYNVTVTDADGCTVTASYTVLEATAFTAQGSGTDITCARDGVQARDALVSPYLRPLTADEVQASWCQGKW